MLEHNEEYYEQVDLFLSNQKDTKTGATLHCCNCTRQVVSSGDYCKICQPIIDQKYDHINFGLNDEK